MERKRCGVTGSRTSKGCVQHKTLGDGRRMLERRSVGAANENVRYGSGGTHGAARSPQAIVSYFQRPYDPRVRVRFEWTSDERENLNNTQESRHCYFTRPEAILVLEILFDVLFEVLHVELMG